MGDSIDNGGFGGGADYGSFGGSVEAIGGIGGMGGIGGGNANGSDGLSSGAGGNGGDPGALGTGLSMTSTDAIAIGSFLSTVAAAYLGGAPPSAIGLGATGVLGSSWANHDALATAIANFGHDVALSLGQTVAVSPVEFAGQQ
jgi:hypothetical protein